MKFSHPQQATTSTMTTQLRSRESRTFSRRGNHIPSSVHHHTTPTILNFTRQSSLTTTIKMGLLSIFIVQLAQFSHADRAASGSLGTPPGKDLEKGWRLTLYMVETEINAEDGDCFQGSSCGKPRLDIGLADPLGIVERSIRWGVDPKNFVLVPESPTLSLYVSQRDAENLTLAAQISGVDPKYGFPRICDSTDKIFIAHEDSSFSASTVTLEGTCFNTSLMVSWECCGPLCPLKGRKETNRSCCVEEVPKEDAARSFFVSDSASTDSGIPIWLALCLGTGVLCLLPLSLLLLALYLNERRSRGSNSSCFGDGKSSKSSALTHQGMCRSLSEESKYDVPWDQKFRPLPDYVRSLANGSPGLGGGFGSGHSSDSRE